MQTRFQKIKNLQKRLNGLNPDDIRRELARRSLDVYAKRVWEGYSTPKHIKLIANALHRVEAGEIKRLMIFFPPRHGKSMLTSEYFPAWYLGRNPDKYIIHATYGQELSDDFGRKVRNQLTDPDFKKIFLNRSIISDDSQSAKRFTLRLGGSYFAVGVGGPATGRGAHLLLIDDPLKGRQEADSPIVRARLKDWYKSVAYTRLMPGGAIVIIQTRWHYDDLAGWLLREHGSESWEIISLPAIATDESDLLGRKPGEALWPEQYDEDRLQQIKAQIGPREWSALYQQNPLPSDGAVFDIEWFARYKSKPDAPRLKIHSWDTGIKPDEVHDPTVFQSWSSNDRGFYLLDVIRKTLNYPDKRRLLINLANRDAPHAICIEDKGSGQSLIQDLRTNTRLPIIAMPAVQSKVTRAQEVSPTIEAGRVFLPESANWLADFEIEVQQFPAGAHDDQVDAMVHALRYFREQDLAPKSTDNQSVWADIPSHGAL